MGLRRSAAKGALAAVAAGDDVAFSAFYREHLDAVVAFFRRWVSTAELAFDLAAETFAAFTRTDQPHQRSSYVGLADPRTRRITVRAQHRRAAVPRTVTRSGAFWSLLLPPGTGRVRVVEQGADGSTIRLVDVR